MLVGPVRKSDWLLARETLDALALQGWRKSNDSKQQRHMPRTKQQCSTAGSAQLLGAEPRPRLHDATKNGHQSTNREGARHGSVETRSSPTPESLEFSSMILWVQGFPCSYERSSMLCPRTQFALFSHMVIRLFESYSHAKPFSVLETLLQGEMLRFAHFENLHPPQPTRRFMLYLVETNRAGGFLL